MGYDHVFAAPDLVGCGPNVPCRIGPTAVQDALNVVLPGGQVTVLGTHAITVSLNTDRNLTLRGSSGASITWNSGGSGNMMVVADENLTVSGLTLDGSGVATVFDQIGAGALVAYANNFVNFAAGYIGSGLANLRHNWWGGGLPVPANINNTDAEAFRLGAAVASFAEGSGSISLPDSTAGAPASLSGPGGGTLVIVNHDSGLVNVPFGKGTAADTGANQCADFYDFYVIGGSGTYSVTIPLKAACMGAVSSKLYQFATDGGGAPDLACTPATACWNSVTADLSGNNLTASIDAADLAGTPFAAPSINDADPTAVSISALGARSAKSSYSRSILLLVAGLTTALVWRRFSNRRRH
jgi:hypothetical protein